MAELSTPMENRQISNSKAADYLNARRRHWDAMASVRDVKNWSGGYYHWRLGEIYRFLCAPGQRVMAIECGTDHGLADARPGCGFYRYGNGPVEMESALKQRDFTHLIIHHDLFNHCAKANFAI